MNLEIKVRDLIAAGWHESRRLGPALRRARDLESTGLERADVLARLEAEFPKQLAVILPRHEPAPLAEAIRVGPRPLNVTFLGTQHESRITSSKRSSLARAPAASGRVWPPVTA